LRHCYQRHTQIVNLKAKDECRSEQSNIMEDYGYLDLMQGQGAANYDEERERIFAVRRLMQMERIFSKAHKDNMIMEIKLFRMMKED